MSDFLPARPTMYRGIRMRSRLEARFAAFLDREGYLWEYEPLAFANQHGQYLPDFHLIDPTGEAIWYVEVKPTEEIARAALRRMEIVWDSYPAALLVMVWPFDDREDYHSLIARGAGDRVWR